MRTILLVVLLLAGGVFWVGPAFTRGVESMQVQLKETRLRADASFFGEIVKTLVFGDEVQVTGKQADWYEVDTASGSAGWVHESALTTRRIEFAAGDEPAREGADTDEVALGARGLTAEHEEAFKERRRVDFAPVDEMEDAEIEPEALLQFVQLGGLTLAEGGGR